MARRKKRSLRRSERSLVSKKALSSGIKGIIRLLPLVIIIAIVCLAVRAAGSVIYDSDYFKLKAIRMAQDRHYKNINIVATELDSKKGMSIFAVDLKQCEQDIRRRHPEMKDVRIKRILPDTLEVSYSIRKPFCQIDANYFYVVSDDMVIFPKPLLSPVPDLPILSGIDVSARLLSADKKRRARSLERAIGLLNEIKQDDFSRSHKVLRMDIYDPRNPALYIEDGTRIEIGEYSFKQKSRVLKEVLADLALKNKKAKVIDLRFDDVVVIPRTL